MKIDMSLVRSETTKLVAENDEEMAMSYNGSSSSGSSHKRFVSTSSSGLSELSPMELSSSSLSKRVKTMNNGLSSSNNSPRASPSAASPPHSSSNSTITSGTNAATISLVQNSPLPQMSAANANSLLSFLFTTAAAAATTANNASNHIHSNNHSNSQTPTSSLLSKSLECVDSSLTYVDTTSGEGEHIKLTANRFALNMASNMRAYVQAHVPPDTLLKFANNSDVTLIAHKLLLYNASPFFRRKYNEVTQQNGIYIIKLDANFCANSVQTCLEYIYSMGLGDLELGAANSLASLKHTAQCLELTDLARLVELLIDREPPSLLPSHQNSVNNNHHQVAQQQLNQIYTNLMIEQLLKKLCNTNTNNNDQQQQQQQSNENKTVATTKTTSISDEINNTRFMSLFNRSRIDLSRFESDFELDTISRDLVIKEKYVYPSQDLSPHFLDACFENSVLINLDRTNETDQSQISNEFQRHALIIFSINLDTSSATPSSSASATPTTSTSPVGCGGGSQQPNPTSTSPLTTSHSTNNSTHQNHHHSSTSTTISPTSSSSSPPSSSSSTSVETRAFKLQNFVIKSRLNFTELSLLKEDISRLFEQFLNQVLVKSLNIGNTSSNSHQNYYRCVVNRVCYLKKPSNCKTIRVETIKSSTDCLRAIVEYSRVNESTRELPYVFLTTHSSVYVA